MPSSVHRIVRRESLVNISRADADASQVFSVLAGAWVPSDARLHADALWLRLDLHADGTFTEIALCPGAPGSPPVRYAGTWWVNEQTLVIERSLGHGLCVPVRYHARLEACGDDRILILSHPGGAQHLRRDRADEIAAAA